MNNKCNSLPSNCYLKGTAGTITIGNVVTGEEGTNAMVTNRGTKEDAILDFVIHKGDTGATGTLTLHVSDDGTDVGIPIVGATFVRCDADGNTYGDAITSNDEGNAIFNNVPFAEADAPTSYYKHTASDGEHTFVDTLQNTTLQEETSTLEIENLAAASREFNLTDANYSGLPIADANITLTNSVE